MIIHIHTERQNVQTSDYGIEMRRVIFTKVNEHKMTEKEWKNERDSKRKPNSKNFDVSFQFEAIPNSCTTIEAHILHLVEIALLARIRNTPNQQYTQHCI